jgi:hypothetical protein
MDEIGGFGGTGEERARGGIGGGIVLNQESSMGLTLVSRGKNRAESSAISPSRLMARSSRARIRLRAPWSMIPANTSVI